MGGLPTLNYDRCSSIQEQWKTPKLLCWCQHFPFFKPPGTYISKRTTKVAVFTCTVIKREIVLVRNSIEIWKVFSQPAMLRPTKTTLYINIKSYLNSFSAMRRIAAPPPSPPWFLRSCIVIQKMAFKKAFLFDITNEIVSIFCFFEKGKNADDELSIYFTD